MTNSIKNHHYKNIKMNKYIIEAVQTWYYRVEILAVSEDEASEKVFDRDLDAYFDDEEWETYVIDVVKRPFEALKTTD